MATFQTEINSFLETEEANLGLESRRSCELCHKVSIDDDEAYKYFLTALLPTPEGNDSSPDVSFTDAIKRQAAKSYRAMTILKQDLSTGTLKLIRGPPQAGLLAKDLFMGLSKVVHDDSQMFRTYHMRELLDALVEKFPEKVMSAAAAGGKECVEEHLWPLLQSDQTLPVLTHLVCIGATGRKGIASAEKSAQHTAMYYHMRNDPHTKVSLGQRRKFVKAMTDFSLMNVLSRALTSTTSSSSSASAGGGGEELCESILTIVEVVGYPPDIPLFSGQAPQPEKDKAEMVGEDTLLGPLGTSEWWKTLLEVIQKPECAYEQREAICRVCHHVFALATGNSTRVLKSHAPAMDATDQASETLVEEKEEHVINRLIEWGLTDKIHTVLQSLIPLLIQALNLPSENIMSHQATLSSAPGEATTQDESGLYYIRHPGRYQTQPLGSWRIQLLSLLKEILTYRGESIRAKIPGCLAMDAIMALPVPPEVTKSTKSKTTSNDETTGPSESEAAVIHNPWPALCSFVWSYPNNDFYHVIFFQMLQAVVLVHHEASLRLILQKAKFLSRAVNSLKDENLRGIMMNCVNLLKLRSESLPPSAFLYQYLGSHDGWKANVDLLADLTMKQQIPVQGKNSSQTVVDLALGSQFAKKLGLGDIKEWDASTATTVSESSVDAPSDGLPVVVSDACRGSGGDDAFGVAKATKKSKKKKKK